MVLEDKSIITSEETMVENLNDFFVNVAGKHSTDGVVDVAQKLCSKVVNNVHTLFLKPRSMSSRI